MAEEMTDDEKKYFEQVMRIQRAWSVNHAKRKALGLEMTDADTVIHSLTMAYHALYEKQFGVKVWVDATDEDLEQDMILATERAKLND